MIIKNPSIRRFLKPIKQSLMGTITHVITDEPVAALTFDDGPHNEYTPLLLDVLKQYNAHATFFMVGEAAIAYPEIVKRVYEEGHAIGNHTYNHVQLPGISFRSRFGEIINCKRVLKPYGQDIIRPPWGSQTTMTRLIMHLFRYKVIAWNVTGEDWLDLSAESIADEISKKIMPGCIILMHDRIYKSIMEKPQFNRTDAVEGIRLLLERMNGVYRFVTVPELFRHGKPSITYWNRPVKDRSLNV